MATEQQFAFPDRVRFLSTQLKPNEIGLVPYSKVGEHWTIADEVVLSIAQQSVRDGTFKTVFFDCDIASPYDFLAAMKSPSNAPVFAFRGSEPVGFAWLNHFEGNHALGHFCFLSNSWGVDAVDAGEMIVEYWLGFRGDLGEPLLDVILGMVPQTNVRAHAFVKKLGFVHLGAIPHMMRCEGKTVPAEIFYRAR